MYIFIKTKNIYNSYRYIIMMVRWLILPSCSGHVCNQQASLRCTVKALAAQAIAVWVLLRTAYCPSARTPWSLDVTAQQENITHRK